MREAALLRLLACASPAFPTGGFAYSQGLEWAVEAGDVRNEATLLAWLRNILSYGAARADAIFLCHAHRVHADDSALAKIAELAAATCLGAERQAETWAQGTAFAAATQAWGGVGAAAYPVAFGAFAASLDIGENDACLAFLASWASAMISAAIRLGCLGQAGGLRVLAALEPRIIGLVAAVQTATLDDLGGTCLLADIAAMRHETQYARLFRS